MQLKDIIQIISLVITAGTGIWWVSSKLQQLTGEMNTLISKIDLSAKHQEMFNKSLMKNLDEARAGRAELWKETNSLRERVVKVESKLET